MPAHRVEDGNFIKLRNQKLVNRVKELAKESHTDPATWVTELVENFILEHRSHKPFKGRDDRHTERHDDFDCGEYHVDPYDDEEEEETQCV